MVLIYRDNYSEVLTRFVLWAVRAMRMDNGFG